MFAAHRAHGTPGIDGHQRRNRGRVRHRKIPSDQKTKNGGLTRKG
jgi:hypothetical protein